MEFFIILASTLLLMFKLLEGRLSFSQPLNRLEKLGYARSYHDDVEHVMGNDVFEPCGCSHVRSITC